MKLSLHFLASFLYILLFANLQLSGQVKYKEKLLSTIDFNLLKGKPLSDNYTNIESVKLCYDIAEKKIYYINSSQYKYHIDFCVDAFGLTYDIEKFNNSNYTDTKTREYVLASFNYYKSLQLHTIEFVSEDNVNIELLQEFLLKIKETVDSTFQPKLLINNTFLENVQVSIDFPKVYPSQLFYGQSQQILVQGKGCGLARKIDLKKDFDKVEPTDIIFIKGTPLNLPICSGVVTETFQTPLSHINILCHNRKTPAAVVVNYDSLLTVMDWYNKPIRLTVTADKATINACPVSEIKLTKPKSNVPILLKYDSKYAKIEKFSKNGFVKKNQIGAKAYGLLELYKIQKTNPDLFEVPADGFAIPFYYFKKHMQSPRIAPLLKALYNWHAKSSPDSLLKVIRKEIKKAPIDLALLDLVTKQLTTGISYRFRSSSNAEDLANFNGAGLYDSYTGIKGDTIKTIENAIKKVWASVYNLEAYTERKLFNMAESSVAMAVLVHRGFPTEDANGVAITKNIFRSGGAGFTINVQIGEESVVAPRDTVQCDQMILIAQEIFFGNGNKVYPQYITRSNLTSKPVLTQDLIEQLYFALEKIKWSNYARVLRRNATLEYENFALDIEFKFDKGKLYIKQVRPFNG